MLVISVIRAVMLLTGVSDAEDLDETIVERFEAWASRPLGINGASHDRLMSSGLFSNYQVATLCDYRKNNGDILSVAELALVDGFDDTVAEALSLFVSFDPVSDIGALPDKKKRGKAEIIARGSDKKGLDGKVRYTTDMWSVAATMATAYADVAGRRGRVILGNFNARFGQGLVMWSGFEMSGLRDVASFERRASALSPSWSYTDSGTLRGMAGTYSWRRWQLSAVAAKSNLGANLTWYGRRGQAGVSVFCIENECMASVDVRYNVNGTGFFGECAYAPVRKTGAFRAGVRKKVYDRIIAGIMIEAIPSGYSGKKNGEYGADAGIIVTRDKWRLSATTQYMLLPRPDKPGKRNQWKSVITGQWQVSQVVKLAFRATERLRTYDVSNKTGLRADIVWSNGILTFDGRTEAVRCDKWGLLSYVEAGKTNDSFGVWLRVTGYRADKWNDRVYCYERDAPGSFNVPAYYGRGGAVSAVLSWKKRWHRARMKIYARTSTKTGHKLQVMLDF